MEKFTMETPSEDSRKEIKSDNKDMSRRRFLKMVGVGAGMAVSKVALDAGRAEAEQVDYRFIGLVDAWRANHPEVVRVRIDSAEFSETIPQKPPMNAYDALIPFEAFASLTVTMREGKTFTCKGRISGKIPHPDVRKQPLNGIEGAPVNSEKAYGAGRHVNTTTQACGQAIRVALESCRLE